MVIIGKETCCANVLVGSGASSGFSSSRFEKPADSTVADSVLTDVLIILDVLVVEDDSFDCLVLDITF